MLCLCCGGVYIVYNFRGSVLDVLVIVCKVLYGTTNDMPSDNNIFLLFIKPVPLPLSTRKNCVPECFS